MVVGRFGVRAVVGKGVCLVAVVSSQEFNQFHMVVCIVHAILLHPSLQSGVCWQSGGGGGDCG